MEVWEKCEDGAREAATALVGRRAVSAVAVWDEAEEDESSWEVVSEV